MAYFIVEIPMDDVGRLELERATRTLDAAQTRLRRSAADARMAIAGVSRLNGRLVCLIEAPSLDVVRRLVALALLPAGRIREVGDAELKRHTVETAD
jgi:hypothetical protein